MTSIPEDTGPSSRPEVAERIEEAGQKAEMTSARLAAAIAGALDGFVEALERYDVAEEGRRAVHDAGEIARAGAHEARVASEDPELRKLGAQVGAAGSRVSETAHEAAANVRQTAREARESIRSAVDDAKRTATHLKDEVKVRGEAVAETGRRAKAAPRQIAHEMGEAWTSWKRALVTSIAMFGVLAVTGIAAFIVLTIALVVGLNEVFGDPAGTFVVALLYVLLAGIAWGVSKAAKTKAAREREERMENVREEIRHVVRPVKSAFGRGRPGA